MTATRTRRAGQSTELRPEREAEEVAEETTGGTVATLAEMDAAQGDDDLAGLGVQLPDGAMGTIWRLVEGGEKEFVDEQPVAGFSVAQIAARFGGGRYVMYLKKPHPEIAGRWFKAGSKNFRVVGPARYNVPDAAAPSVAGAVETGKLAQAYGDMIMATVKQQTDNANLMQSMQLALLKSMAESRPQPAPDKSTDLLQAILLKLLDNRSTGPSLSDLVTLADKMANRNGPTSQLKETLEMIQMARELGGGEAAGPPWIGIASKALDAFTRAMPYNPAAPVVRQLAPGAPTPASQPASEAIAAPDAGPTGVPGASPTEVPTVSPTAHPLLHFLAPQIPALIEHATADHDPDTYAGMLADMIPAQHSASVIAFLTSPDFMQQLQATFPMTQPLQEWFSELRDNIVDRLQDDDDTPPPDVGPAADGSAPEVPQ